MNEYLNLILETMSDSAPGLIFDKHKRAKAPKRAYRSGHEGGPPCSADELSQLKDLCGSMSNGLDALVDLYTIHNGIRVYKMPSHDIDASSFAVELFPFSEWDKHTAKWTAEDMAWAMEGCPLYDCGLWKVIGSFGSEAMNIVLFFSGEYEGVQQSGRCYCLGLDGYLGYEEELAVNFEQLAVQLSGKLIVETLNRVGFTGFIQTDCIDGQAIGFGDVVKKYLPNVTRNRYLND